MIAMKTAMLLAGTLAQAETTPPRTIIVPPVVAVTPSAPTQDTAPPSPARAEPVAPPVAPTARANSPQDVVVVGQRPAAGDPLISVNAKAFGATQAVDTAVVGPVSLAYKRGIPAPVRSGIHNFLYNLREPIVFVNFLLQFKVGKAAETAGRFVVNSTVGAVGLIDIAKRKPFRLPRRSNGFANTLGFHGVKNGPFLFLPLVGPTTVRDLFGGAIDRLLLPVAVGSPFNSTTYTAPAGVLGALDHRAEFDETLKCLHDDSADPYTSSRNFYLERRQAEIEHLRGRPRKSTPRCETVGFGIGTTPPPSVVVPVTVPTITETPPVDSPPVVPADTSSGALPEVLPSASLPSVPAAPPPPPSPTTSDVPDPAITPPATNERVTDPG